MRRGVIVVGDAPFGQEAHRYHLSAVDASGAVYTHGGAVLWPLEAQTPVQRTGHADKSVGEGCHKR